MSSRIEPRRRRVPLFWHVWMAVLAAALVIVVPTHADPDLWGHVRFGLDWLQSHRMPSTDQYSFTHDKPYVDHEWLGEVAIARAFSGGGAAGLIALKTAIVMVTLAVVAWRIRRAPPLLSASVVLLAAVSALPIIATARPQVTSLLGLTVAIAVADSRLRYAIRVMVLAVVFAVWANLHGGWITGFGALGAYTVIRWYRSRMPLRHAVTILLVPFAATLLNAYGVELWRFLATTVRTARPDITEWQPIGLHEPAIMWFAVLFPIVLVLVALARRDTRPSPEIIASIIVLVVAGLRVSRVAPLIGPAVAAALGPSLGGRPGADSQQTSSPAGAAILAAPVIVLWAAAIPWIAAALRCIPIHDSWAPDLEAARYLEGAAGRLWVAFDWGEYAFWHFGPALRVSIDGRREAVYSDHIIQLHRQFDLGVPSARDEFATLSPDYVWLRRNPETERWLSSHGYRMVAETGESFVAARSDVRVPTPGPAPSRSPCFR